MVKLTHTVTKSSNKDKLKQLDNQVLSITKIDKHDINETLLDSAFFEQPVNEENTYLSGWENKNAGTQLRLHSSEDKDPLEATKGSFKSSGRPTNGNDKLMLEAIKNQNLNLITTTNKKKYVNIKTLSKLDTPRGQPIKNLQDHFKFMLDNQ